MRKYQNKMSLYVTLITCAILPSCYGQGFRKTIRFDMNDVPEIDDQKLRDPRKEFHSQEHLSMKWRDPNEMFDSLDLDDLSSEKWRDPHEMFGPPHDPIPENWRDPHEMFGPPHDPIPENWRDPHEMFGPPHDLIPENWRDPQEMFRPPHDPIPENWRDPLEMFGPLHDPIRENWRDPQKMFPIQSKEEMYPERLFESPIRNLCQDTVWISHYKRLVNMLLNTANVKSADGLTYKGKLEIKIDVEKYNLLMEFANSNKEDIIMLQEIDDILSSGLSAPSFQHTAEILLSWKDCIYTIFWNTETILCLSCIFVLFLSRQFFRANLSLGSIFKRLIFLGWIVDFCFCWLKLLQEAEINRMVTLKKFSSIPDNCDPIKELSFWSYVESFFGSSDDCKAYYHALHTNYFFSVSPLVVFSHQLEIIAYNPAAKVGEALGSFTSGILGQLPWGVNVLLLPVVLVFAAMILFIGLIFLTKKSLGVSILGLFKFNFGNNNVHHDARLTGNAGKISEVAQKICMELTINLPKPEDKTQTTYEIKSVLASDHGGNFK